MLDNEKDTFPMVKINGVFTPYTECITHGREPISKQDDLILIATLEESEADVIVVHLEKYFRIIDGRHHTKFEKVETVINEIYEVEVYKSHLYTVNLIKKKDSSYKGVEVKTRATALFAPKVYIDFKDDFEEERKDFKVSVQTTSYGSLDMKDFKTFLYTQNEALKHIKEIESIVTIFMK